MPPSIDSIPECAHATPYRVCYADTDRMGRVYYANYLVFAERARTDLMRASGLPYGELENQDALLPVRRCEVRYHGYADFDDELIFRTWVNRLKHATVRFVTAVCLDDAVLAVATVELACISRSGAPRPLPPKAVQALENYVCRDAD